MTKILLALCVLTLCWATVAHAQTTDGVTNRPYSDVRMIQVNLTNYDVATKTIHGKFEGPNEKGPEGDFTLNEFTAVTSEVSKHRIQLENLEYLLQHVKEKHWVVIYTNPDRIALTVQQTMERNRHNFFWWASIRMEHVTIDSLQGNVVNCKDNVGSFKIEKGQTYFTANPDTRSTVVLKNVNNDQLVGDWIFTYQVQTRIVIAGHKFTIMTARFAQ